MGDRAVPTLAESNSRFEDWRVAIDMLAGLSSARQIAYECSKKLPAFLPHFDRADQAYRDLCAEMGATYQAPFDSEAYAQKRRAEGHPDFQDLVD